MYGIFWEGNQNSVVVEILICLFKLYNFSQYKIEQIATTKQK